MSSTNANLASNVDRDSNWQYWTTRIGRLIPGILAGAFVCGIVALGLRTGGRVGKFSDLYGRTAELDPLWCDAHSVAESICVECHEDSKLQHAEIRWCRVHGIHDCPHCNPEVAQLDQIPTASEEEIARIASALDYAIQPENNSRCQSHLRRIQFSSARACENAGISLAEVRIGSVSEVLQVSGELEFDPTRVARISSRGPGIVWRKSKRVGDSVQAGEIMAIVDSANVGKAKTEYQQAITNLEFKLQSLARRKSLEGQSLAGSQVQAAELEAAEAQVRLLAARQALLNLGLPVAMTSPASTSPLRISEALRFSGFDPSHAAELADQTKSNNLLPIRAPFDGVILSGECVAGESVDELEAMFVIADLERLWLTLQVPVANAQRVRIGQAVQFQHEGHDDWDKGLVSHVGPSVDPNTGSVPVIVELPNSNGEHVANAAGTAKIHVRQENRAIVVPTTAIHWDGDCHIVFVRDKYFTLEDAPKVFHVRKVRPGTSNSLDGSALTEVIAGLLEGEIVAAANSEMLRAELLKNDLGVG